MLINFKNFNLIIIIIISLFLRYNAFLKVLKKVYLGHQALGSTNYYFFNHKKRLIN